MFITQKLQYCPYGLWFYADSYYSPNFQTAAQVATAVWGGNPRPKPKIVPKYKAGCEFCGKDCPCRQVPAPMPFSTQYCDDCYHLADDYYGWLFSGQ